MSYNRHLLKYRDLTTTTLCSTFVQLVLDEHMLLMPDAIGHDLRRITSPFPKEVTDFHRQVNEPHIPLVRRDQHPKSELNGFCVCSSSPCALASRNMSSVLTDNRSTLSGCLELMSRCLQWTISIRPISVKFEDDQCLAAPSAHIRQHGKTYSCARNVHCLRQGAHNNQFYPHLCISPRLYKYSSALRKYIK